MNALMEKGYIREMECGPNVSYVLSDNNMFLATEYKVLQSQTNSCFVKCMKMMYNGKVQLYYFTKGLKSFASMIPSVDPVSFFTIVENLFSNVIEVKNNGFLSLQNVDITFERIYVDPATLNVSLVYLPISKHIYDDASMPEHEMRLGLVKLISGMPKLSNPNTVQFAADLSDESISLEALCARIKNNSAVSGVVDNSEHKESGPNLRIIAINAPDCNEIIVTKDDFVIGKKAEICDAVVNFNKAISRSHCRINKMGNQYTITDLQSANGTYINKIRLQPYQPHPIRNGDMIRLANSDFQVYIE